MNEEENLVIKCSYQFDSYLMYLVQEVTKRPSAEIVAFFYELATQVAEIGVKSRKDSRGAIRKNIIDYFPGTSIPFHMLVKGRLLPRFRAPADTQGTFKCQVEVGFPESRLYMQETQLRDISVQLMEKALLDGPEVNMAKFEKPEIRTPKIYKKLMDAFMERTSNDGNRRSSS